MCEINILRAIFCGNVKDNDSFLLINFIYDKLYRLTEK